MDIDSKEPIKKVPIIERDYYITPKGDFYNSKGQLLKGFVVNGVVFHEVFIQRRRVRFSKLELLLSTWGELFNG